MKQKFKGLVLSKKKCVNNILSFLELFSFSEHSEGLIWYINANEYCRELAARYNVSLQQVAGIIAAFSPQCSWSENKRFALSFLINSDRQIKSKVQYDKALKILSLTSEKDIYNALALSGKAYKTKAFFLNILNPQLLTTVTIDRHAIGVCLQKTDKTYALGDEYGNLTFAQYMFFKECYIEAAKQCDIMPQHLQAITWLVYRRQRELKAHTTESQWQPFSNIEF